MEGIITLAAPYMRYVMLFIILYVVIRMLVAMFFKKTSDPLRGKLVDSITGDEISLYDRETSIGRYKKCDIVLPFDTISRLHAVITYRSKGFMMFLIHFQNRALRLMVRGLTQNLTCTMVT